MSKTAKVVRLTADGQAVKGTALIAGIQVLGGTANTLLYNGEGATAAELKGFVTAPAFVSFDPPIYCPDGAYIDAGTGATDVLVHVV